MKRLNTLVRRIGDVVFDPLWDRFGRSKEPTSPDVAQFRRDRERWVRQAEMMQRWEQGRRR